MATSQEIPGTLGAGGGRKDPLEPRRERSPAYTLFSDLCPQSWERIESCGLSSPPTRRGWHFVMTASGHSHGEDQEHCPQRTSSAVWLGHSRDTPSFQNHTRDTVAVSCNAG